MELLTGLTVYHPIILSMLIISILILITIYIRQCRSKSKLPGPTPLPLIGTLYTHSLFLNPQKDLGHLRNRYGGIVSLHPGNSETILLSDYDLIRKFLTKAEFSNRGTNDAYKWWRSVNHAGLVHADYGSNYINNRRLLLSTFRELGAGHSKMEPKLMKSINLVIDKIRKKNGVPFNPDRLIGFAVSDIVSSTLFNHDMEHKDLHYMMDEIPSAIDLFFSCLLYNRISWIFLWPPMKKKIIAQLNTARKPYDKIGEWVHDSIKNYKPGRRNCFIDIWLDSLGLSCYETGIKDSHHEELVAVVGDTLGAGLKTTKLAILWFIIYVTNRPTIQMRLFEEITNNVGQGRLVGIDDKDALPFLQATILETLRMASIIQSMVRQTDRTRDVQICEYTLRKGSAIDVSLLGVHTDATLWKHPFEFRPDRFLNAAGTRVVFRPQLLAFGIGKRICPGKSHAMHVLFLITSNLLQRFQLCVPKSRGHLNENPVGLFSTPDSFDIVAEIRGGYK